jgi:hypothetical protein
MTSREPYYVGYDNNKVKFLTYLNHNGRPFRDVIDLAAGSFNKENHINPQYLASHQVGLAWAAAASDREFHDCLARAHSFCIRVGHDKGTTQSVDTSDHLNQTLIEILNIEPEQLLTFPTFEEVFNKVTTYEPESYLIPHRSLPSDVFLHPDASVISNFTPWNPVKPVIFQQGYDDAPDYVDSVRFTHN